MSAVSTAGWLHYKKGIEVKLVSAAAASQGQRALGKVSMLGKQQHLRDHFAWKALSCSDG